MSLTLSFMAIRGGRGDRTGRYGSIHNDHNFRDMDYRAYGQEDEEEETDRSYGHDEQMLGVCDLQDRLGFHQRGDGRGDIGCEGKWLLWPPSTQSQPDLAHPMLQREEEGSRQEFEQLRTGQQERGRGRGGRGFPDNSTPHSGSRDGNWGRGGAHSEQMEYNMARQREEERFSRGALKRRVNHNKSVLCVIELLLEPDRYIGWPILQIFCYRCIDCLICADINC